MRGGCRVRKLAVKLRRKARNPNLQLRALCVFLHRHRVVRKCFCEGDLSPLHQAAADGDIAEVKRLIDGGADIDVKTNDGDTPLHSAAWFGQTETALALINAGADINAKENDGWTPLHIAAQEGQTEIALALIKAGADIHGTDRDGWTPLHLAACKGQTETIIALIHAGAYLKATDNKGNTALDVARQYKKWEAVSILENPPPPKPKASPPPSGESAPNVSVAPRRRIVMLPSLFLRMLGGRLFLSARKTGKVAG